MKCGNCTLCCKLLPIDGAGSPAGKWCKHSTEDGCNIYEKRPEECVSFRCAYLQMKKASINMRPDNCGVIFEKITDNIFLGTTENSEKLKKIVMGQIASLNKEGFSVIINSLEGKTIVYKVKGVSKKQIIEEVKEKWQHRVIPQI